MKLSIVIPIYGVEKYIEKCLLSCINQKHVRLGEDYEIICVNDGTKDRSALIAHEIALKYVSVYVIDQENGGLSAARNTGTTVAKGDYIWYVDSDDYIEEGTLARILPKLKDNIDIFHLRHRLVYEDGKPSKDVVSYAPKGVFTGKDVAVMGGLTTPAQFSIVRTAFLKMHGIKFYKGIYHEDIEYKPRVTYLAEKIVFDDSISYNYLQREGTIMSTFRPKRIYDLMIVVENLLKFSQEKVDKNYIRKWSNAISSPLAQMFDLALRSNDNNIISDVKQFVNNNPCCGFIMSCSRNNMLKTIGMISRILGVNTFIIYRFLYTFKFTKK